MSRLLRTLCLLAMTVILFCSSAYAGGTISDEERFRRERSEMVEEQIQSRGIKDKRLLQAMGTVPRHEFVPADMRQMAYIDTPLPIGEGQTISSPYNTALMIELAEIKPRQKILEVGTGSGYQAALLAQLTDQVYTIESQPALALRADTALQKLGYENVHLRMGDGSKGWPEEAPFDTILMTSVAGSLPQPLIDQLVEGGVLIVPAGSFQRSPEFHRLQKKNGQMVEEKISHEKSLE